LEKSELSFCAELWRISISMLRFRSRIQTLEALGIFESSRARFVGYISPSYQKLMALNSKRPYDKVSLFYLSASASLMPR
jgi:hypothetical protein